LQISIELGHPEIDIRFWSPAPWAIMAMPKAALNHHRNPMLRQNNIRRSGEIATMYPKTKAGSVQRATNEHLGSRVLTAHAGHHPGSMFGA